MMNCKLLAHFMYAPAQKAKEATMKAVTILQETNPRSLMKLNALIHLRKAILEERYEECGGFIAAASKWGAKQQEIKGILHNPLAGFEGM